MGGEWLSPVNLLHQVLETEQGSYGDRPIDRDSGCERKQELSRNHRLPRKTGDQQLGATTHSPGECHARTPFPLLPSAVHIRSACIRIRL